MKFGKMTADKNSFHVIWFFFKHYKPQLLLLFVLSSLVGLLEAANVAAIFPILNVAFDAGAGEGNLIVSTIFRMAGLLPIADDFIAYAVLFLIIALLVFVTKLATTNFRARFSAELVEKNQNAVLDKLIKADYQYFINHKEGELLYNVVSAPQLLSTFIVSVTELTSQGILSISVLFLLFSLSWPGAIAMLLVGIGYHYFTKYLGKKISYSAGKGEMEAIRESNVVITEAISGIKQIKVFNTAKSWIDKFNSIIKVRWYHFVKRNIWQFVPNHILMLILYLSIGVIAILIKIIAPSDFTELIPLFGTFAFAIFRLFPIVGAIGGITMQMMAAMPNCETVYSIQNTEINHVKDGVRELDSFKSKINFDNVTFSYKGRPTILEDISVTFENGKTTAIVGRSGSGKTTIINLILRLFESDKGEIKIDGIEIKEYRLSSWLDKIGFVSQDTFIFNDTVKNNITFGSDQYSDEDVSRAAEYADAHSFILELPEGYDTLVGDKGVKLSGGQRQRIAVARAMIRKPEILIFDEATNALDSISEATVQKAIDEISKDHTMIVIAHRLSTIANADKIIVLEDGRIVKQGIHETLMKSKGVYRDLYQSQPVLE